MCRPQLLLINILENLVGSYDELPLRLAVHLVSWLGIALVKKKNAIFAAPNYPLRASQKSSSGSTSTISTLNNLSMKNDS